MHIYSIVYIKNSILWFLHTMVQNMQKYLFKMVYTRSPTNIFANTVNVRLNVIFWT